MASENRASAHSLIEALEQDASRYDFFEALRIIESQFQSQPRLGTSIKVSDDPVRFAQPPELQFPASTLSTYTVETNGIRRLEVNFFGLFGSHGALPLHLTEFARERLRHHHDPTFARFADIFHHRMICLFYRAWANARPTVSYDRPDSDRFAFYVGSLLGIGGEASRKRDALTDCAKLFYAGHFSGQTKSPEGLQAIIADVLSINVHIEEFIGEWMEIQQNEHTRLGYSPEVATLGQSALLGGFVWGCQHKFRIVLGPLKLGQYLALLPGAEALAELTAMVRNYIGDELVWDAKLILKKQDVPIELMLGQTLEPNHISMNGMARLGWSMWLGPRSCQHDADDLTLNPFFRPCSA
jgi:type VI secretion system protein ImpH